MEDAYNRRERRENKAKTIMKQIEDRLAEKQSIDIFVQWSMLRPLKKELLSRGFVIEVFGKSSKGAILKISR